MTITVCLQETRCTLCNNVIEKGAELFTLRGQDFCSPECLEETLD